MPFALALLLYAVASDRTEVTDGLAIYVVIARVGQSTTHLISTSSPAVLIRFAFFAPQVAILLYWIFRMAMQLGN